MNSGKSESVAARPIVRVPSREQQLELDLAQANAALWRVNRQMLWIKQLFIGNVALITSIAIHTCVLLLGYSTYTVAKQVVTRTQEQVIVPDAKIIAGAEVGGIPNPGLGNDPTRKAAAEDGAESISTDAWAKKAPRQLQAAVMNSTEVQEADSAIGIGTHSLSAGLAGAGESSAAAPFGMSGGGGGVAPKSIFMGVSGNARKIIYVCDWSGSMASRFELLKAKLLASINDLVAVQNFNVIFFRDDKPVQFNSELLPANNLNKQRFATFLEPVDVVKGGDSDPRPALRTAFLQQPDLIYFLTDGDFIENALNINEQVRREIRLLNREKKVHINTIAFTSDSADAITVGAEYVKTLKAIAEESGGTFRIVSSRQMP